MSLYRPNLIENRTSKELKDGIIHELRHILPNISFSILELETRIRKVQLSHFELEQRKESVFKEIEVLEQATNWKFRLLFEDCISYPDKAIYRTKYYHAEDLATKFCSMCEDYEIVPEKAKIKLCSPCLELCRTALIKNSSIGNSFIFKTPESDYWCEHADKDTLLLSTDKYCVKEATIICKKCIEKELEIR